MSLPEQIGRLRRIERIGAGGFATVWRYQDDELNSPVAVKALADNWAQRLDIRERFLDEARILRRADSDHVVRVYDLGEVNQVPYFVMSYASHGTLADLLQERGPMQLGVVADLVDQIGIGLQVLHSNGVIHRDIKPQNLLLDTDPDGVCTVLVADLGVAKAELQASGLTQVVGTPAYMAPEQARGAVVDRRADVHALGAVAYQLVTGQQARTNLHDVTAGSEVEPPSQHRDVPEQLDTVLLRALTPDPERRWPDVPAFTSAFRAAVEGRSVETDRGEPREYRLVLVVLLAVLLLAAAFAGAYALVSQLLG